MKKNLLLLVLLLLVAGKSFSQQDEYIIVSDPNSTFFDDVKARLDSIRQYRPTVALVLSGGGAKGAAHIGVLKVLEEKNIPVDFIAGTSMGSLVGGLYALGYPTKEIDEIMFEIDWEFFLTDRIPRRYFPYNTKQSKDKCAVHIPFTFDNPLKHIPSSLLYGYNVNNLISLYSAGYHEDISFSKLPIPFCCNAFDIVTQREVVWTSGSLRDALRSSMSIPGIFLPVKMGNMLLADGGVINSMPTDIAKKTGADIIIAVDLRQKQNIDDVSNMLDIAQQVICLGYNHERNASYANVVINPDLREYSVILDYKAKELNEIIEIGYQAAKNTPSLDSIARLTSKDFHFAQKGKNVDIRTQKVLVNSIEIQGVTESESEFLSNCIGVEENKYYDAEDIEGAVAGLYGRDCFQQVSYSLVEDVNGAYRLTFICEKKPSNSFQFGVRTDSEETVATMFKLGLGKNNVKGSVFELDVKVGLSPYMLSKYEYVPTHGPKFGVSMLNLYRTDFGLEPVLLKHPYNEQSWRNEWRAYATYFHFNPMEITAGLKVMNQPFEMICQESQNVITRDWSTFHAYLYGEFNYDNRDDAYFTRNGVKANVSYHSSFAHDFAQIVAASGNVTIPLGSRFTITPGVASRVIFGDDNTNKYMQNVVGGFRDGRFYDHQIAFIGYNGTNKLQDVVALADISCSYWFAKLGYVGIRASVYTDGNSFDKLNTAVRGVALQAGYKLLFIPIRFNFHWNDQTYKTGFYFSTGLDF